MNLFLPVIDISTVFRVILATCYFLPIYTFKLLSPYLNFTQKSWVSIQQEATSLTRKTLEKKILNFVNVFFAISVLSPLEKGLNPNHQRMLCAKFGWNWPRGSGDENFSSIFFCYFIIICPWTLHLNWLKSPKKSFVPSLIRKAHLNLWLRWAKTWRKRKNIHPI